jgi:hypothetical protein
MVRRMSMPGSMPPSGAGRGHGPFGKRAFHAALAACGVSVVAGLLMLLLSSGAIADTGTALLVLGLFGLACAGFMLLAERVVQRRGGPPPRSGR